MYQHPYPNTHTHPSLRPPRPIRSSSVHFYPPPSGYLGELGIKPQSHSRGPHDSRILKENLKRAPACAQCPAYEMGGFVLRGGPLSRTQRTAGEVGAWLK